MESDQIIAHELSSLRNRLELKRYGASIDIHQYVPMSRYLYIDYNIRPSKILRVTVRTHVTH